MIANKHPLRLRLVGRFAEQRIRSFASRVQPSEGSEEDQQHARQWLSKFNTTTIPRHIGEVSFSRSSGPGGQNVNKVNSKATLRVPLDSLKAILPKIIFGELPNSTFFAKRTGSLLIQADSSRKQNDNVEGCWVKLYDAVQEAGKQVVVGQTSPEQAEKVKELQRKENEARIKMKKALSSKKSSRRGKSND